MWAKSRKGVQQFATLGEAVVSEEEGEALAASAAMLKYVFENVSHSVFSVCATRNN